jgi:hypothetical protein
MVRIVENLVGDWSHLDERIENMTDEIEALARGDASCRQLMTVPGIGPIIASAMVAAIGNGIAFARGRDFAAWLGLVPKQISTGDRTILGRITKAWQSLSAHALHAGRPALFCSDQQTGRSIALGCGSRLRRNAYIITSWQLHSPISWRGSLGPCWHKVAATKRASSQK